MDFDCIAKITNLRETPFISGYRPAHLIREGYYTTGLYDFDDDSPIERGESRVGRITFISPEVYPHTLYVGRIIDGYEGSRMVTTVEVVEILNPLLVLRDESKLESIFDIKINLIGSLTEDEIRKNLKHGNSIHHAGWKLLNDMYPSMKSSYVVNAIPDQGFEIVELLVDYGDVISFEIDYEKDSVINIEVYDIQSYMKRMTRQKKIKMWIAIEAIRKDFGN